MQPSSKKDDNRVELFRERLENILNRSHELYKLAGLIEWSVFEEEIGRLYAAKKGRPGIPIRLMVGLSYLGHAFGLSDEAVVTKWVENPYWQYFCGETYFQHQLPFDPSSMSRWRKRIGEKGCELILAETLQAGLRSGAVKESPIKRPFVKEQTPPFKEKLIFSLQRTTFESTSMLVISRLFLLPLFLL